jgi:hypothetical protein
MALKAVDNPRSLVWGPTAESRAGEAGLSGVISTTIQSSFQSEVEVVGGDGELVDKVYSGPEQTVTETKYGNTFGHTTIGAGTYENGITIKSSIQYSNEDATKIVEEKLKKLSL